MRQIPVLFFLLTTVFNLPAQTARTWTVEQQQISPVLDGQLNDSCWQAPVLQDGFTTSTPFFGKRPRCATQVRMFYTPTALFIAVECQDPDEGGVREDRSIRDQGLSGDWVQVSLDTWHDSYLSFDFTVSAAGVQFDDRMDDQNWDAVWQSAVHQRANSWTVEIRIPFTALRFPRKNIQEWGVQISRFDRSSGQLSTWSPQNPLIGDRVLQFGTLSGIRNIQQIRRRSLALHSDTELNLRENVFKRHTLQQSVGVDAKLGLSEQATLDFTLLPPVAATLEWFQDLDVRTDLATAPGFPLPRQFSAEESGLFERNTFFTDVPVVSGSSLAWRYTLQPNERFMTFRNSTLLQATKLSARTKGNLRFGAFHALMGPVSGEVRDLLGQGVFDQRLQGLSNYNYLSAEYVLPNNSFVHLSNGTSFSGKDMYTLAPQVHFQLRTPSNTLESRGDFQYQYRLTDTFPDERYNYGFSVGRINRRFGWRLGHQGAYQEQIAATSGLSTFFQFDRTSGELIYQSFDGGPMFMNRRFVAAVSKTWFDDPVMSPEWFLSGSVSVLDYNFRNYSLIATMLPHTRLQRYDNGGAYIDRRVAPMVGAEFNFRSDIRRRFIWSAGLQASSSTQGEFPSIGLQVQPDWVVSNWVRLSARATLRTSFENLILLSVPGRWVFEQSNQVDVQSALTFNWYPVKRFGVFSEFRLRSLEPFGRQAVELETGGKLIPVDWPLDDVAPQAEKVFVFGFTGFFSDISQVKFEYTVGDVQAFQITPSTFSINPTQYLRARLSVVWFLVDPKNR